MSSRLARQAGIQPATIAAATIQSGVHASDHQGKASWIVQPKKARLITPVSTSARQSPEASPSRLREQADHAAFPKQQTPDLRR